MTGRILHVSMFGACIVALVGADAAMAQFDSVSPQTQIQEKLSGRMLSGEGAPDPEPGDQVACFYEDQILGVYTFVSTQTDERSWEMTIFGDDPQTPNVKEGPAFGDPITFRFYDASTNTIRQDVAALNAQGEVMNVVFEGEEGLPPIFNLPGAPPLPGFPSKTFDLILGVASPPPGSGGNGDGGTPAPTLDVNGDGVVDKRDAAIVMRVMIGASRGVSEAEAARADVNGDGVVDTRDVIEILRNRGPAE